MKKYIVVICILSVAIATLVFAQRIPRSPYGSYSQKDKFFDQRITALEQTVEELTSRLKAIEEKLNPTPELKKQGKAYPIKLPFEIGQVVYFSKDEQLKIVRIIDGLNTIAKVQRYVIPQYITDSGMSAREIHPGNPSVTGLYEWETIESSIWLRGLDTSKWATDSVIKPNPNQLFKITGTKKNTNVRGESTLFVLEPYND